MRKTTAVLAAIALLAGLSACSASDTVAGCTPTVGSGDVVSSVSAKGKLNSAPTVTFPTPLYAKTTQQKTLIPGHGAAIQNGQPVIVSVTILNGRDGAVLQKTSYSDKGDSIITTGKSAFPAISEALKCAQVGSRIAVVGSPKDSHNGTADATNGIKKNDSFVYVVDIHSKYLAKANGSSPVAQNGLPTVITSATGRPGLVFPDSAAPKTVRTQIVQSGSGTRVKKNDYLVLHYTGVAWDTGHAVFESTWKDGQATVLQVGGQSMSASLSTALIGQRVGSQVLVVLPAKNAVIADGSGSVPAATTVVYVVDILGIAP